eukprot:416887_1
MASFLSNEPIDILLHHSTYLSLLVPYLPIKFIFSTIVLLSKYQLSFMTRNENKKIIQRLITSQIGSIFTISRPFTQYYFDQTTNPYKLIPMFYNNFGFIEQIAFPKHHQQVAIHCIAWQHRNKGIDWESVEVVDNDEEYYNPFEWQYNAIKYTRIPFDFVVLLKLKKAQFVINWLTYVLHQKPINCNSDLNRVLLNIPEEDDPVLNCECKVLMITAINNYDRTGAGYPLNINIIRNVCDWPCDEFAKLMRFILHNSESGCFVGFVLCYSLRYFCSVDDFAIGSANYCIYLEQYNQHKKVKNRNTESLSSNILTGIDSDVRWLNLYRTMFDIICTEYKGEKDLFQSARLNPHYVRMFGAIGNFLREHVKQEQLERYVRFLDEHAFIAYSDWAELGGAEYRELFLDLLGFA